MVRNTIQRIRSHLREPGVTKKGLAEKAGLHPNTLQGVDGDRWNPSAATLIALERQLPAADDCTVVHADTDTIGGDVGSPDSSGQNIGQVAA